MNQHFKIFFITLCIYGYSLANNQVIKSVVKYTDNTYMTVSGYAHLSDYAMSQVESIITTITTFNDDGTKQVKTQTINSDREIISVEEEEFMDEESDSW